MSSQLIVTLYIYNIYIYIYIYIPLHTNSWETISWTFFVSSPVHSAYFVNDFKVCTLVYAAFCVCISRRWPRPNIFLLTKNVYLFLASSVSNYVCQYQGQEIRFFDISWYQLYKGFAQCERRVADLFSAGKWSNGYGPWGNFHGARGYKYCLFKLQMQKN